MKAENQAPRLGLLQKATSAGESVKLNKSWFRVSPGSGLYIPLARRALQSLNLPLSTVNTQLSLAWLRITHCIIHPIVTHHWEVISLHPLGIAAWYGLALGRPRTI